MFPNIPPEIGCAAPPKPILASTPVPIIREQTIPPIKSFTLFFIMPFQNTNFGNYNKVLGNYFTSLLIITFFYIHVNLLYVKSMLNMYINRYRV